MSLTDDVECGRSKVYDDDGRTVIPEDIREKHGWKRGTTLKFVSMGGEVSVVAVDEE